MGINKRKNIYSEGDVMVFILDSLGSGVLELNKDYDS
jgi:hypothetical protein